MQFWNWKLFKIYEPRTDNTMIAVITKNLDWVIDYNIPEYCEIPIYYTFQISEEIS